jgi:putative endonuclease
LRSHRDCFVAIAFRNDKHEGGSLYNDSRPKGLLTVKERNYYVYIMTNRHNTVLYTGVTSNLVRRIFQHKDKTVKGFTAKYNIQKLVYFEHTTDINAAISREKQIKAGSRARKIALIQAINPKWKDLWETLLGE